MTAQEKIWKVIRGLGEFTVDEVVVLTGLKRKTIAVYLSTLHNAEYLRTVGKKKMISIYRLVKNTGPKAPTQKRCIYDPNRKETLLIKARRGKNA